MKVVKYKTLISKTEKEKTQSQIDRMVRNAESDVNITIAKHEKYLTDLENKLEDALSSTPFNIELIVDIENDLALAKLQLESYSRIKTERF